MSLLATISYAITAPISIFCQVFLIYSYLRVKQMKKHPESLIILQCISQIILDIHWLTGISTVNSALGAVGCQTLGAFFVYCYFICWDYILCLSLEILIKIRDPLNTSHKRRMAFYHVFSHTTGLTVLCLLAIAKDNHGGSLVGTCFVRSQSIYELIVLVPIVVHMPVCLYVSCYIFWLTRKSEIASRLKHHNYVVFAFSVCWGINGIAHGLNYEGFRLHHLSVLDDIAIIIGGPSGFIVFLARITQKGLFKNLVQSIFSRKASQSVAAKLIKRDFISEDSEIQQELSFSADYSDIFEGLMCNVFFT
jgi:hypothetical protein